MVAERVPNMFEKMVSPEKLRTHRFEEVMEKTAALLGGAPVHSDDPGLPEDVRRADAEVAELCSFLERARAYTETPDEAFVFAFEDAYVAALEHLIPLGRGISEYWRLTTRS